MNLVFTFLSLFLLMLISAFFSGSETALSALTRVQLLKLRRDKSRSCQAIVGFLDEPRRLLITVLFGNILVNMAFVSITGALIYDRIFGGNNPVLAYVTAILIETLINANCSYHLPLKTTSSHSSALFYQKCNHTKN